MAFNHLPADTLSTGLQQRLEQLESYPLHLPNDLTCDLRKLRLDYVSNVVISNETPHKFDDNSLAEKKQRYEAYEGVLVSLQNNLTARIDQENIDKNSLEAYIVELQKKIQAVKEVVNSIPTDTIYLTVQNPLLLGEYVPKNKSVILYIENIQTVGGQNWELVLAYVYIHEMMHAFFDSVAQCNGSHYLEEVEEPLAELGMLYYLKNACSQGDGFAVSILPLALNDVTAKQATLPHYAYGAYLYSGHVYTDINGNPKGVQINEILSDYAIKASRLDKDSTDVIEFCVSLASSYPCSEHEGLLFSLLIHTILNVGQKQVMKFVNIFEDSKKKLKEALWERWSNKNSKFDDTYKSQIEAILDNGFSENILVENMSPWKSTTPMFRGGDDWDQIVPNLWKKPFPPYKHQVEAWKALLSTQQAPYSSMVVTTGTGSGKTECFMAPLIADLASQQDSGVQAIFLYPLNALMEDQKERLNDMIEASGADIKFAVYNGMSPHAPQTQQPEPPGFRYKHELVYREEIQGRGLYGMPGRLPNIILTNPTMLEYMLLRREDQGIINNSQKKLRWIVIDETHTFTGAGADEIAMLIKRLLLAFDETANDVRFTTSSATIGKANGNTDILKFISGITGQPNQTVISGSRSFPSFSLAKTPTPDDKCSLTTSLALDNYVPLKDLIPYKTTTKEKLEELDRLSEGGLKVKVHFYEQALTNGLFVDLKDIAKGQFQLRTDIPLTQVCALDPDIVRAVYCKDCGEVMANCMIEDGTNKYIRETSLQTDENGDAGSASGRYIAINRQQNICKNTIKIDIDSQNQRKIAGNSGLLSPLDKGVSVCPCCGGKNVYPFNVSSMATNKAMAPVLLDNANPDKDPDSKPYEGRQFISFADSRSSAAKPSMAQNLDTEEQWVISVIKNKLEVLKGNLYQQVLNAISVLLPTDPISAGQDFASLQNARTNDNNAEIQRLASKYNVGNPILTWDKALDELFKDPYSDRLAQCFAKKEDYDVVNGQAQLKNEFKRKYVLGALYNVMHRRPRYRFSAEGWGIMRVVYPKLDNINALPSAVDDLNVELRNAGKPDITIDEWKNYLKIFLDFEVRTNEELFYRGNLQNWDTLDIDNCRNLKTSYGLRRTILKPKFGDNRMSKLLFRVWGYDDSKSLKSQQANAEKLIQDVLDSIITSLHSAGVIDVGYQYRNGNWIQDTQRNSNDRTDYRMNLSDMSFALYDSYNVDDSTKTILDTTFFGFSPWDDVTTGLYNVLTSNIPSYTVWPTSAPYVKVWLEQNNLGYLYCDKLAKLYNNAKMFVQLEHTAQVSREISRNRIEQFKNHEINILSCSTTMEMGVDIGELELVAMSNIPPHPANYKQRAGRAGRAAQSKSACMTVCNSDAVGLSVIEDPKTNLLEREVVVPTASLKSPQILKRHFNSYLLREFYRSLNIPNLKTTHVIDFFFDQRFFADPNYSSRRVAYDRKIMENNGQVNIVVSPYEFDIQQPNRFEDGKNGSNGSLCKQFEIWLNSLTQNDSQWQGLDVLKSNTAYSSVSNKKIINDVIVDLHALRDELYKALQMISDEAQNAPLAKPWPTDLTNRNTKWERKLNYEFTSLLGSRLIEYCSQHQFTPNANMPVNIVALKTNAKDDDNFDNPSRDIRTALSEYAPGNMVIIDGKSYMVAGVDWNGHERSFRNIHICKSCGHAWEGLNQTVCPFCNSSSDKLKHYRMIEPAAFITEADTSRIMWNDDIRNVKAKLLGTGTWNQGSQARLYEQRSSQNSSQTSSILYYNEGTGSGYAVCNHPNPHCGRTVHENKFGGSFNEIRDCLYNLEETDETTGTTLHYHENLIGGKDYSNPDEVLRNMIFGGSVQTDYVEFKPYRLDNQRNRKSFISTNPVDRAVVLTLGIMFADELAALVPCQRQDVDFLINTYANHELALCLFDTAKGGAGYSINLGVSISWDDILDRCRAKLDNILNGNMGISSLLSRATMKYLEQIDVNATYDWLCAEHQERDPLPNPVRQAYPDAVTSSYSDLKNAYNSTVGNSLLFIQGTIDKWNYDLDIDTIPNWKDMKALDFPSNGNNIPLVLSCNPGTVPAEMVSTIYKIQNWADLNILTNGEPTGVYFLAYINGYLYVTDDEQYAQLDGNWGNGNIYKVLAPQPQIQGLAPDMQAVEEIYIPASQSIGSTELFDVVCRYDTQNVIANFLTNARGHRLQFEYLDEHLKTQLGMYITIQFMKKMIDKAQCTNYSIRYVNEVYDQSVSRNACRKDDPNRRLYSLLLNNNERDDLLLELTRSLTNNVSIESKSKGETPHYRCLTVTDLDTNQKLLIKPHGGFATDWDFDSVKAFHDRMKCYPNTTDINTPVPICSKDYKILYTLSNI